MLRKKFNLLKDGGIPRKEIRRVLNRIYNQNSTLTIKPIAMQAYLDQWSQKRPIEEIDFELAWAIIQHNLVELESGNEHYDEENYRAVEANIENLAWSLRYDVGDTVECIVTTVISEDFHKIYKISGFVTRCTNEWHILYVRGIKIRPTSTALTRMILTEKTIADQW